MTDLYKGTVQQVLIHFLLMNCSNDKIFFHIDSNLESSVYSEFKPFFQLFCATYHCWCFSRCRIRRHFSMISLQVTQFFIRRKEKIGYILICFWEIVLNWEKTNHLCIDYEHGFKVWNPDSEFKPLLSHSLLLHLCFCCKDPVGRRWVNKS